jgi:polyadenylate-binding protein
MATTISSLAATHSLYRRCCRSSPSSSPSTPARVSFRAAPLAVAAAQARRRAAVQVFASSALLEAPEELATRKLYVGNIPRTVTNDELAAMFAEHGTVVRTEVTLQFLMPL